MVKLNVQALKGKQLAVVTAGCYGYDWNWLERNQDFPERFKVSLNSLQSFIEIKQVSICPVEDSLVPGRWIAFEPGDAYFWGEYLLEAVQKCYCGYFAETAYVEVPDWVADLKE